MFGEKASYKEALIGGYFVEYFCLSENKKAYDNIPIFKDLKYLGKGFQIKINGVLQSESFTKDDHFWGKK